MHPYLDEDLATETEFLLREAREIAERTMGDASEELVLVVFNRLCAEMGVTPEDGSDERVLH